MVRVRWCCRFQSALETDEEIFHGVTTLAHSLYHGLRSAILPGSDRVFKEDMQMGDVTDEIRLTSLANCAG